MKLLYIHGFLSSGNGTKAKILKKHFGSDAVISPDLPVNPDKVVKILSEKFLYSTTPDFIIGSSLGGFYANHFHKKFSIPCLLLNPSIKPHISLKEKFGIGTHVNPDTLWEYTLKNEHISAFDRIYHQTLEIKNQPVLRNIIVCKDDELLPYLETLDFYSASNKIVILNKGGHQIDNFEKQIPLIKSIIKEYEE